MVNRENENEKWEQNVSNPVSFFLALYRFVSIFHLPVPRLRGSRQNWTVLKSKQNKTN